MIHLRKIYIVVEIEPDVQRNILLHGPVGEENFSPLLNVA